jgi:hypothetical protein
VTGQVVNRRFINDLPLVDRYVLDFVGLAPGVNNMSDSNSVGDTGTNFASNGSRGANADILMDGASITNFEPNRGITQVTYTPSAEAVEEFKVQQTNFSAEYGFSGSSIVNMITRPPFSVRPACEWRGADPDVGDPEVQQGAEASIPSIRRRAGSKGTRLPAETAAGLQTSPENSILK